MPRSVPGRSGAAHSHGSSRTFRRRAGSASSRGSAWLRLFGRRRADVLDADVVVAADGTFSRVRSALFGLSARFTGSTAWRGWIDDLPTDTFTEVWGRGARFGVTPQESGRTNWYATARAPLGAHSPGAELMTLNKQFGGWADPVATVLGRITEDSILRHDLFVVPPLRSFILGGAASARVASARVVLLGDAAHAMPPDLGRGACEALIDAVTLASCLRDAANVPDGLCAYDRARRRPTQRLARAAGFAARLTHLDRAAPLRDAALGLALRF